MVEGNTGKDSAYNKGGKDRDEEKRREVGHRKEGNIRENGKIGGGNEEEGEGEKRGKGKGQYAYRKE